MPVPTLSPGPTLEEARLVDELSDLRTELIAIGRRIESVSLLPLADRTKQEFTDAAKHVIQARHWLGECYRPLPTGHKISDMPGDLDSKTKAVKIEK